MTLAVTLFRRTFLFALLQIVLALAAAAVLTGGSLHPDTAFVTIMGLLLAILTPVLSTGNALILYRNIHGTVPPLKEQPSLRFRYLGGVVLICLAIIATVVVNIEYPMTAWSAANISFRAGILLFAFFSSFYMGVSGVQMTYRIEDFLSSWSGLLRTVLSLTIITTAAILSACVAVACLVNDVKVIYTLISAIVTLLLVLVSWRVCAGGISRLTAQSVQNTPRRFS